MSGLSFLWRALLGIDDEGGTGPTPKGSQIRFPFEHGYVAIGVMGSNSPILSLLTC